MTQLSYSPTQFNTSFFPAGATPLLPIFDRKPIRQVGISCRSLVRGWQGFERKTCKGCSDRVFGDKGARR